MPDIEVATLEILNSEGEGVANQFFRQPGTARALALVLPGLNYTCEMPLLYYATHLFLEHGCDVLQVRADYTGPEFQALGKMEQAQKLGGDAAAALQAALKTAFKASRQSNPAGDPGTPVYLLGKSIGTISMAFLLSGFADLPFRPIWLTPLLRQPLLLDAALSWKGSGLWIASVEDPTYASAGWIRLVITPGQHLLLLDRGNHRLEVPGEFEITLDNLQRVLLAIQKFISN